MSAVKYEYIPAGDFDMTENTILDEPIEVKEVEKTPEPAWYDWIVKLVKEFLEFNMITYRKEKTPRL